MKYSIFKESKYHNKKCEYNGIKFDSIKEMRYYTKLELLQRAGEITELKRQVRYLLLDTIRYKGKTYPKTYYIADFQFIDSETGKTKVIDIKSEATRKDKTYRLKIKMLLNKYPDIDFDEIL